jgi:AcrR family transcriptional regulator
MTKTKRKISGKPKQKRKYDNSARAEKSSNTQKAIIEALVSLLAERRGGEVQMSEVAERTGITQRTIFRFFEDKKALHEAMDQYLVSYVQASAEQLQTLDFVGFAKFAFAAFDRNEALTTAYVLSPFGNEARALFRKKLNHAMIERVVKERKIKMDEKKAKRLALVTALVNAKIWYDMKTDFGYTGEDLGEAVEWALNTLLEKL